MPSGIHGLYTIADNTFRPEKTPVELARAYLEGGAKIVQLRMKMGERKYGERRRGNAEMRKTGDGEWILDMARGIMQLKHHFDFTFIVNDHVDIALEVGADGVHVGADDLPVAKVRRRVGGRMRIGYSSHSLVEAVEAEKAGADYVAFGAVFPTKTKGPGHPVQGLQALRGVVEALRLPVVAIGGITRDNFRTVLETGAAAVAMITALTDAKDIVQETRFFVSYVRTLGFSFDRTSARAHERTSAR